MRTKYSRGMQSDCKGEQVWFTRLHETDNGAFLRAEDDMLCYAEQGTVTPVVARKDVKLRRPAQCGEPAGAIAAVWGACR